MECLIYVGGIALCVLCAFAFLPLALLPSLLIPYALRFCLVRDEGVYTIKDACTIDQE
jgi:hypothetical protein